MPIIKKSNRWSVGNVNLTYILKILLIPSILSILFLAVFVNVIVNIKIPFGTEGISILKASGNKTTWIIFFGSMFGSMVAGVFTVITALLISKHQVESQKKELDVERKERIKTEINISTAERVLTISSNTLALVYKEHVLLRKNLKVVRQYYETYSSDITGNNRYYNQLKNTYNEDLDKWCECYDELTKELNNFLGLYNGRKIILSNLMPLVEELLSSISQYSKRHWYFLEQLNKFKDGIFARKSLKKNHINDTINNFNAIHTTNCNKLEGLLITLMTDTQNEFLSELYNRNLAKPKYKEDSFKPLANLDIDWNSL